MRLFLKHAAHDGKKLHTRGFCPDWPDDVKPPRSAEEAPANYVAPEEIPADDPDTLSAMQKMTLDEARKVIEAEEKEKAASAKAPAKKSGPAKSSLKSTADSDETSNEADKGGLGL